MNIQYLLCAYVSGIVLDTEDTAMTTMGPVRATFMSLRVHLLTYSCQCVHPWVQGCFLEPMPRAGR